MSYQKLITLTVFAGVLSLAGCAKKVPVAQTQAPKPTVTAATPAPKPAPAPQTVARTEQPTATTPTSRYPDAATKARINELLARISDAYFNYNEATLRPDAVNTLRADSTELRDILKNYPDYKLTIEGYCDERGSSEYNMALGEERAAAAKEYLVTVGIPATQLGTVSYGKERQICEDHDEACWQKNRRIHIVEMASNR